MGVARKILRQSRFHVVKRRCREGLSKNAEGNEHFFDKARKRLRIVCCIIVSFEAEHQASPKQHRQIVPMGLLTFH
jgi:hypothetical protein